MLIYGHCETMLLHGICREMAVGHISVSVEGHLNQVTGLNSPAAWIKCCKFAMWVFLIKKMMCEAHKGLMFWEWNYWSFWWFIDVIKCEAFTATEYSEVSSGD
jgi:hypothetical protein